MILYFMAYFLTCLFLSYGVDFNWHIRYGIASCYVIIFCKIFTIFANLK